MKKERGRRMGEFSFSKRVQSLGSEKIRPIWVAPTGLLWPAVVPVLKTDKAARKPEKRGRGKESVHFPCSGSLDWYLR